MTANRVHELHAIHHGHREVRDRMSASLLVAVETSEIDDGSGIYDGTRAVDGSCHLQQRTASAPRSTASAAA